MQLHMAEKDNFVRHGETSGGQNGHDCLHSINGVVVVTVVRHELGVPPDDVRAGVGHELVGQED